MPRKEDDKPHVAIDPTVGTFSKLPRESLRALYYKLGGTDDISDLRTRRALLKKIYEAMGNDSADLDNMHRASSVLQKISEVASVGGNGGKYVGVDISDEPGMVPFPPMNTASVPVSLSSKATAEINAILSADKIPIIEVVTPDSTWYGLLSRMRHGGSNIGWSAVIMFSGGNRMEEFEEVFVQSSDYRGDGSGK